jgi:hypothetical protein
MNRSSRDGHHRKWLAAVTAVAVLLFATSANAWWGGYRGRSCDPQTAYLEEYGFFNRWGPSRGDMRRLNRDQWRATTYYGGYYDPTVKALRKRCPTANRWRGRSYYW